MSFPIISIKSKQLHERLGIKEDDPRAIAKARKKLVQYGATIIDKEFISESEIERITQEKLTKSGLQFDWVKGSSFEHLKQ